MNSDETILQFGAGNFLRGFVDVFVSEANAAGQNVGRIVVVQSTPGERAQRLNEQNGRYHVVVRGIDSGAPVDRAQVVDSISRALVAQTEWPAVVEVARGPALRAVVSNTTEAGFVLDDNDSPNATVPPRSFPARLLALLKARFDAHLPGLLVFPCELLDNNGDRLRALVLEQAARWSWTSNQAFAGWLNNDCVWVSSLVDRIVSGKPAHHPLLAGDPLLVVAEPYQFWAVENKPGTDFLVHPALHRANDVAPFSLRKVRLLNGAHTALLAHVRRHNLPFATVREALADEPTATWLRALLFEEIVPVVADRVDDAAGFARQTLERLANPFLDHQFSAIALYHDTKVQIRLVPTRDEFIERFGRVPQQLNAAISD